MCGLCRDVEHFNGNRPEKTIYARLESLCEAAAKWCIHIEQFLASLSNDECVYLFVVGCM